MMQQLTPDHWQQLVDAAEPASIEGVAGELAERFGTPHADAADRVEAAVDSGPLSFDPEAGTFGRVTVENTGSPDETPTPEPDKTGEQRSDTPAPPLTNGVAREAGEHYPPTIVDRDVWVCWLLDGAGRKRPVAPWQTGHAYPVKWSADLPAEERPETDFDTAKKWADFPPGRSGLELPDDAQSDRLETGIILPLDRPTRQERFTLIDWDDVRDPETGEIHPVATQYIGEYGGYVEISTSGEGLHQYVTGGLRKRGKFIAPIDDTPFIGDDLPQVEMYDGGRHVAMTGRHVDGADRDAVEGQELIDAIIQEYADAEKDAGHRRYDPQTGEPASDPVEADGETTVPDPERAQYDGPPLEELMALKPDGRPLRYHAAVYGFYTGAGESRGYAGVLNWRLEGIAAALGEQADIPLSDVLADLAGGYLEEQGVEQVTPHRTPERVRYAYDRAQRGRLEAPNTETMIEYGLLPPAAAKSGSGLSFFRHVDDLEAWAPDGTDPHGDDRALAVVCLKIAESDMAPEGSTPPDAALRALYSEFVANIDELTPERRAPAEQLFKELTPGDLSSP